MITKYGKLLKQARFNDDIAGPVSSMFDYCIQNGYTEAQAKSLMDKYIQAKNNGEPLVAGTYGPEVNGKRQDTAYITPTDFAHYVKKKHFTTGDDLARAIHAVFDGGTVPNGLTAIKATKSKQLYAALRSGNLQQADIPKHYNKYIIRKYNKLPPNEELLAIIGKDYKQKYFPNVTNGIDKLTTLYGKPITQFNNGVQNTRFIQHTPYATTDIFPFPTKIQYLTQEELASL